jgi:sugar/nucleoside kinase (ribokinase family)
MAPYDVLLQGTPFCDLTFSFKNLDVVPSLGQEVFADEFAINPGGVFNISSALSRFGLRVGLKALLGNDMFSRFVAEQMRACDLSVDLISWVDAPMPVVTVGVSFRHDRLFISYSSSNKFDHPLITVDDLDRYRPKVFFTFGEGGIDLCDAARQRGIPVYLDSFWNPTHLRSAFLRDLLPHVDVFAPNLPEALEMTSTTSASDALDVLSRWCPCVAIKCGAQGCVGQRAGERVALPALDVEPQDTTGAGDNFNAGFIYGMLQGYSFERCLRCASIAGGLSTQVLGGCGSASTAEDIEKYLGQSADAGGR